MNKYHCEKHKTLKIKQQNSWVCIMCQQEMSKRFIKNPFESIFGEMFGDKNGKQ